MCRRWAQGPVETEFFMCSRTMMQHGQAMGLRRMQPNCQPSPSPAQVLASIGQLEFFYDQAPDVMRSCSMALQLLSVCIGSYLSGALVGAVSAISYRLGSDWLPQDLNYGRLDLFFLLLAGGWNQPRHAANLPG